MNVTREKSVLQSENKESRFAVSEIFYSLQGEARYAGYPCVFVRLSGCPLRCAWCDTEYARHANLLLTQEEIMAEVKKFPARLIEFTGGEPLWQKNITSLITCSADAGYNVLIETGGSISIEEVVPLAHVIMDIKAPSSGETEKNLLSNIDLLKNSDEVKVVIANRDDFFWLLKLCDSHPPLRNYIARAEQPILLQPAFEKITAQELGEWVKTYAHIFRLGMQWHKYIYHKNLQGV